MTSCSGQIEKIFGLLVYWTDSQVQKTKDRTPGMKEMMNEIEAKTWGVTYGIVMQLQWLIAVFIVYNMVKNGHVIQLWAASFIQYFVIKKIVSQLCFDIKAVLTWPVVEEV